MKIMKKRKGMVLIMVLVVMALLTVLVTGYLVLITTDLQISQNHQYSAEALALADAGIENAIVQLRGNYAWSAGFTDAEYPSGSGNTCTVTVNNNYPVVVFNSTSTVRGQYSKQVEARVIVSGPPLSPRYPVRLDYWKEI